jgi:hypothetical protein
MITKETIDKAILAHGKWKTRLNDFINGKAPDFDIAKAGTDNNCEFGKWIYGDTIDDNDKNSDYYNKVKILHTDFHKSVKEVAELVISGKKEDAKKMISDFSGSYSKISTKLILLLTEWDKAIK